MKSNKLIKLGSVLLLISTASLQAEEILIAGWNMSSVPGDTTNLTKFDANMSDLYDGDGVTNDGVSGALYADGQYGSTAITNSVAFTFYPEGPDSSFNSDIVTTSRPAPNDMNDAISLPGDPSPGNQKLAIADGTFGAGGGDDPSGDFIVFAAFAPDGQIFSSGNTYKLVFAVGNNNLSTNQLNVDTSIDGVNYTSASAQNITSGDQAGTPVSFVAGADTDSIFFRMQVPQVGFGSLLLDNVQIIGSLGDGSAPETTHWPASPEVSPGWKYTADGYPAEHGVGWIYDANYPIVYMLGLGGTASPAWVYIHPGGTRNGFYAYNINQGYWFYGINEYGFYYKYNGSTGEWMPFNL